MCSGKDRNRNGVGVIMDERTFKDVVEVCRKNDWIIRVKIVNGEQILSAISVYALQVEIQKTIKRKIGEDLDDMAQNITLNVRLYIGGDINGHIGVCHSGYKDVHDGLGKGIRNTEEESVLDFALSCDLLVARLRYKKRDNHLVA